MTKEQTMEGKIAEIYCADCLYKGDECFLKGTVTKNCKTVFNRILALIAADRAGTKEKHFNDCMSAKKSGYEEGKAEALRKQAGLVEALKEARLVMDLIANSNGANLSQVIAVLAKIDSALKEGK